MNHEYGSLADVQSMADDRRISLNRVGIKNIRY